MVLRRFCDILNDSRCSLRNDKFPILMVEFGINVLQVNMLLKSGATKRIWFTNLEYVLKASLKRVNQ